MQAAEPASELGGRERRASWAGALELHESSSGATSAQAAAPLVRAPARAAAAGARTPCADVYRAVIDPAPGATCCRPGGRGSCGGGGGGRHGDAAAAQTRARQTDAAAAPAALSVRPPAAQVKVDTRAPPISGRRPSGLQVVVVALQLSAGGGRPRAWPVSWIVCANQSVRQAERLAGGGRIGRPLTQLARSGGRRPAAGVGAPPGWPRPQEWRSTELPPPAPNGSVWVASGALAAATGSYLEPNWANSRRLIGGGETATPAPGTCAKASSVTAYLTQAEANRWRRRQQKLNAIQVDHRFKFDSWRPAAREPSAGAPLCAARRQVTS